MPSRLRAEALDLDGKVRLRWKRPVRRCSFNIEMTTGDPSATTGWKHVDICIRQTCEVTGLESGVKCRFRVAATNAHGQGPWSQPVSTRAE